VRRGTHLGAREAAIAAGDGGRQRGAARDDGGPIASTGKRGRGREATGEHPYRNVMLLESLLDGGERWSGGAASGRGTAMAAAAGKLLALRFLSKGGGCSLGERR
jgi:hypothetical protein